MSIDGLKFVEQDFGMYYVYAHTMFVKFPAKIGCYTRTLIRNIIDKQVIISLLGD